MARYLVVRCERNEAADALIDKLGPIQGVIPVGLFASPTVFCEGPSVCGQDRKYKRSRRWGTTYCSVCKRAVTSINQQPRNLLQDEDLPVVFVDMFLSVREPFLSPDPVLAYGKDAIRRKRDQISFVAAKLKRDKRRKKLKEA